MSYFKTCPRCGAHLDPGERCSCRNEAERNQERKEQKQNEEIHRKTRT